MIPGTRCTVHRFLSEQGPMTIAELASYTGIPPERIHLHFYAQRSAYASRLDESTGIPIRLWHTRESVQ